METIVLENGKYIFIKKEDGSVTCLRYNEPWRDFVGDHAVHALVNEILRARQDHQNAMDLIKEWKNDTRGVR